MEISKRLLQWYDSRTRALPWRGIGDPYKIWVSEIMLQQTQSGTVIRYYERFLNRFPDVFALAEAPVDEVLKLWEGLGYYSRARNLHQCARRVANEGGQFPRSYEQLLKLPGIGKYTAAAIASIAFSETVPALDGNQMRVLSRLFGVERVLKTPFELESEAMSVLDRERPGDHNQALMDLGAEICTPTAPNCAFCPLKDSCEAFKAGEPERYPLRPAPIIKKECDYTVLLIQTPRGICVRKRTEKLLGGLYEFPMLEGRRDPESISDALHGMGVEGVREITQLPPSKHVFTHLIWHMTGFEISADTAADGFTAVSHDELERLAFPGALRVYREIAGDILSETPALEH